MRKYRQDREHKQAAISGLGRIFSRGQIHNLAFSTYANPLNLVLECLHMSFQCDLLAAQCLKGLTTPSLVKGTEK